MIVCIQNLVKFYPSILKILSKNQFLASIKGRNSVVNLRKLTLYNPNVDLVNDNVYYTKSCYLVNSVQSKDIEELEFMLSMKHAPNRCGPGEGGDVNEELKFM